MAHKEINATPVGFWGLFTETKVVLWATVQGSLNVTIPFPGIHKFWGRLQIVLLPSHSLPNTYLLRDGQVKSALLNGDAENMAFNWTFIVFDKITFSDDLWISIMLLIRSDNQTFNENSKVIYLVIQTSGKLLVPLATGSEILSSKYTTILVIG